MLREILQREVLVISDKLKIHQIESFNTYKLQIRAESSHDIQYDMC